MMPKRLKTAQNTIRRTIGAILFCHFWCFKFELLTNFCLVAKQTIGESTPPPSLQ